MFDISFLFFSLYHLTLYHLNSLVFSRAENIFGTLNIVAIILRLISYAHSERVELM